MIIEGAVKYFESGFVSVRDGVPSSHCETGEPYVVVTAQGVKPKGEEITVWCTTPDVAAAKWCEAAVNYQINNSVPGRAHLYWRIRPEIGERVISEMDFTLRGAPMRQTKLYAVYSRFCISEKYIELKAA